MIGQNGSPVMVQRVQHLDGQQGVPIEEHQGQMAEHEMHQVDPHQMEQHPGQHQEQQQMHHHQQRQVHPGDAKSERFEQEQQHDPFAFDDGKRQWLFH